MFGESVHYLAVTHQGNSDFSRSWVTDPSFQSPLPRPFPCSAQPAYAGIGGVHVKALRVERAAMPGLGFKMIVILGVDHGLHKILKTTCTANVLRWAGIFTSQAHRTPPTLATDVHAISHMQADSGTWSWVVHFSRPRKMYHRRFAQCLSQHRIRLPIG